MEQTINKVCRQVVVLDNLGVYLTLEQVVAAIKNELQEEVDEDYIEQEIRSRLKFKLKAF
jgi:hypothetical protein